MGGLGCIGKLITNFIASMTAQRREIIRIGAMAIQVTVEAMKIVCIMQNVTLIMENGMTLLAQGPTPLLSARGQFRRKRLQIHMQLCICSEFPFPYSASCCPSSRTFSPFNLFWQFLFRKSLTPFLTGSNLAFFVSCPVDKALPYIDRQIDRQIWQIDRRL